MFGLDILGLRWIRCITEDAFLTLRLRSWESKLSASRNAKTDLAGLRSGSMSLCYCFLKICLVQNLSKFISVKHIHTSDWNCVRPGRSCFVRARSAWRSPRGSGNETASRQMLYPHYGLMLKRRWIHTVQACKVNPLLPNFQVCPYLAQVKDEVGFFCRPWCTTCIHMPLDQRYM